MCPFGGICTHYTFIVHDNKFMISSQQGSFLFSLIKLAIHQFFNRSRTVGCSILVLAYENERLLNFPVMLFRWQVTPRTWRFTKKEVTFGNLDFLFASEDFGGLEIGVIYKIVFILIYIFCFFIKKRLAIQGVKMFFGMRMTPQLLFTAIDS